MTRRRLVESSRISGDCPAWLGFLAAALLLVIVAAGSDARAGTFYVDAARGDDAGSGAQPETAWRSLARVNRASLAPGDPDGFVSIDLGEFNTLIRTLRIEGAANNFVIDDLLYAIPEPGAWALVGGIGLLGFAVWRRRA